jgi:small subunit ribosomal protein S15
MISIKMPVINIYKMTKTTAKSSNSATKDDKKTVIKKFQTHAKDTGSSQVQVAILTKRIEDLSEHLQAHKKDKHSRKGLIGLVGKRRKLLQHLKLNNKEKYQEVIKALGLRK